MDWRFNVCESRFADFPFLEWSPEKGMEQMCAGLPDSFVYVFCWTAA
jgi:hypothetical protein